METNKGLCRINDTLEILIDNFSERYRNDGKLTLSITSFLEVNNDFLQKILPYTKVNIQKIEFLDANKNSLAIYLDYYKISDLSTFCSFSDVNTIPQLRGEINFIKE